MSLGPSRLSQGLGVGAPVPVAPPPPPPPPFMPPLSPQSFLRPKGFDLVNVPALICFLGAGTALIGLLAGYLIIELIGIITVMGDLVYAYTSHDPYYGSSRANYHPSF